MSSRPALGPIQPPIQWVLGALSLGVKRPGREADHSPPNSAEVKKTWSIQPLLHISSWRSALGQLYFFYLLLVIIKYNIFPFPMQEVRGLENISDTPFSCLTLKITSLGTRPEEWANQIHLSDYRLKTPSNYIRTSTELYKILKIRSR
jgi:hypothetical protein